MPLLLLLLLLLKLLLLLVLPLLPLLVLKLLLLPASEAPPRLKTLPLLEDGAPFRLNVSPDAYALVAKRLRHITAIRITDTALVKVFIMSSPYMLILKILTYIYNAGGEPAVLSTCGAAIM
jgi:hypothetical protein